MARAPSLRRELVFWYVLSFVALIAVSNFSLYSFLRLGIEGDRNFVLNDRFNAIAELLHHSTSGFQELGQRITTEWPYRQSGITIFRLKDAQGRVLVESPSFAGLGLDPPPPNAEVSDVRFKSAIGRKLLVRVRHLENSGGVGPVTVIGAVDAEAGDIFLRRQRSISFGLTVLSAFVGLLLGAWITRRGLGPLEDMTALVNQIDSQNLAARLDVDSPPVELRPLARAFNQSLERLEQSFVRLSRFSSNIAHELRTPVNNMLGELEVHLGRARTAEEDQEMLSSNLEECTRLHQIIESLLFLARAERPARDVNRAKLDGPSLLLDLIDFYEAAASEAGVALNLRPVAEEHVFLAGDKTLFQQAVGNLISNSLRYTPAGGHVHVSLLREESFVRLTVEDSGVGIPPEHLPHVLDRFYRADPSRDHSSGGYGLGLAITKSIMELHGGQVEIASTEGQGTRVDLLWPRWP